MSNKKFAKSYPERAPRLSRSQAHQVQALSKQVAKRQISRFTETKHQYNSDTGTGVSSAGGIVELSNMAQGSTGETRDGNLIVLKSFSLKGEVVIGDTTNVLRVIIFRFKEIDDPIITDILETTGAHAVRSAYNYDKRKLYDILYDRRFRMDVANVNPLISIKLFGKKLGSKAVQFDTDTTSGTNKLWMLRVSDSGAVPNPTMNYYSETAYKDI